jgi:pyrroline-5-carboxylate reductase
MVTLLSHIAILGTGNMGGAILGGLTHASVSCAGVCVTTRTTASAVVLRQRGIDARSVEEDPHANRRAAAEADIVVLGVKPYQILELLTDIAPHAQPSATMVSVAAGITLGSMEAVWPGAIVRCMPNTPSQVGKGVTGVSRGSRVSDDQASNVEAVFHTVGDIVVVDESAINVLSSISGSGPAFVYFFIERFLDVALEYGFSPEQASTMVQGTFSGAMDLLEHTGQTPRELREAVTSPGGSTAAALEVFDSAGLTGIIRTATAAAIARAQAMAIE